MTRYNNNSTIIISHFSTSWDYFLVMFRWKLHKRTFVNSMNCVWIMLKDKIASIHDTLLFNIILLIFQIYDNRANLSPDLRLS